MSVRVDERNSIDPRKDDFLELKMQSSCFFFQDRYKTGINCMYYFHGMYSGTIVFFPKASPRL
jgi:hypothetical protein